MEAKRFTAGDMRRALQMVREHLGPDAVILSSRKNSDGVEVVATNDYRIEDQEAEQLREIVPVANKIYRQLTGVVDTDVNSKPDRVSIKKVNHDFADDFEDSMQASSSENIKNQDENKSDVNKDLMQMRYEMEGLRRMMEFQSAMVQNTMVQNTMAQKTPVQQSAMQQVPLQTPVQMQMAAQPIFFTQVHADLKQRLELMGMPSSWHEALLKSIESKTSDPSISTKDAWRALLNNMQSRMKVAPRDLVDAGGIFALVGPTGAGKTTSIAKLATRYAMQYGVEQVGLISLDTQRVGGTQQLKTMGKLLGIPVRLVDSANDLEVSLRAFRNRSLVMIDTAGVRPGSEELTLMLKNLQVDERIQCLLTLPVTCQYPVMKTLLHCYREISKGLIITKLDEAVSLGEVMAAVIDGQLPIVYSTDGQLIPESIMLPNLPQLIALAVDKIRLRHADDKETPNKAVFNSTAVNATGKVRY